eukprot:PITA_12281
MLKLKVSQGKELVTRKEMESVLVQHFLSIAKEPLLDRLQFISKFTRYIPKLVTREDNHNLNKPVSEDEVSEVINVMKNGKAPSPNGFNVDLFKACWKIVKQDIIEVVEDSRRSKSVLRALNASFIALIPKQEKTITSNRFRPIALCNLVYKIISKVIANRLKPLLPSLISKEQTGYVEGRHILNNIIQAPEMVHSLKRNKQVGMIIQLDLAKSYDKLSWSYIRAVLRAYGFDHNWVRRVMALASMVSFSILLNGSPSITFMPSRGLRILGFQRDELPSKYLGIPLTDKPLSTGVWEPVINKLQDKVRKWTCRYLNLVGCLMLTKAILQAIPIFIMSSLPTPKGILQQIMNIQMDFLWGKGEEKKKWALVAWDKL